MKGEEVEGDAEWTHCKGPPECVLEIEARVFSPLPDQVKYVQRLYVRIAIAALHNIKSFLHHQESRCL